MKQGIFEIKSNVALTATVYKMVLTGDTSAITGPGQFVNILLEEIGRASCRERVCLSV